MDIVAQTPIIGQIQKLSGILIGPKQPIQYYLPIHDQKIFLNSLLGKEIEIIFNGKIHCIACDRAIKKSFQQGYCFPCSQTLARCDICIVRPEKCHFRFGTCREPEWAKTHCMIPHIIYLANTSGAKVGITRGTQIPTRWIDQGAIQALPIARVQNRHQAGMLEVALAKHLADKTDWRKMLRNEVELIDLNAIRSKIMPILNENLDEQTQILSEEVIELHYPVIAYPEKIISINLEKTHTHTGTLLGIKGQYLILDNGVINIRNLSGYHLQLHFF